jgi:hypothetical protein
MFALQRMLEGVKEGPKGLVARFKDGNDKINALAIILTRLDRRWLQLTIVVEPSAAADTNSMADIVQAHLAKLSGRDVPAKLFKDVQEVATKTWKVAEDASSADAVIDWLRLGFSLEERVQFVDALAHIDAKDVVALAHKLAKPTTSATAIILPSE